MEKLSIIAYSLIAGITPFLVLINTFLVTQESPPTPTPSPSCEESSSQTDGALSVLADD